jgi:hypothetical protein
MAFTETEKAKIRLYAGWSERFLQSDAALERALAAVDNRPEAQVLIRGFVADADAIRVDILKARKRLIAYKAGRHELDAGYEIDRLQALGRMVSGQICQLLGVEFGHQNDPWSSGGPTLRSGFYGPTQGGGMLFG